MAFAPVFLRVALGLTMLWSGSGKIFDSRLYTPAEAARLQAMGVDLGAAAQPAPTLKPDTTAPNVPTTPGAPATNPGGPPTMQPPSIPIPDVPANAPRKTQTRPTRKPRETDREVTANHRGSNPTRRAEARVDPPADDEPLPPAAGTTHRPTAPKNAPPSGPPTKGVTPTTPSAPPQAGAGGAASLLPTVGAVRLRRLYDLALLTGNAAQPAAGSAKLLPAWMGDSGWPARLAWLGALVELAAGAAVLVGLFTRLGALGILFVMLTAMWLTELGPAIAAGKTYLYLIPQHEPGEFFAVAVWQRWFWQLALICASAALALIGPGPLALDYGIFSRSESASDDRTGPTPK